MGEKNASRHAFSLRSNKNVVGDSVREEQGVKPVETCQNSNLTKTTQGARKPKKPKQEKTKNQDKKKADEKKSKTDEPPMTRVECKAKC